MKSKISKSTVIILAFLLMLGTITSPAYAAEETSEFISENVVEQSKASQSESQSKPEAKQAPQSVSQETTPKQADVSSEKQNAPEQKVEEVKVETKVTETEITPKATPEQKPEVKDQPWDSEEDIPKKIPDCPNPGVCPKPEPTPEPRPNPNPPVIINNEKTHEVIIRDTNNHSCNPGCVYVENNNFNNNTNTLNFDTTPILELVKELSKKQPNENKTCDTKKTNNNGYTKVGKPSRNYYYSGSGTRSTVRTYPVVNNVPYQNAAVSEDSNSKEKCCEIILGKLDDLDKDIASVQTTVDSNSEKLDNLTEQVEELKDEINDLKEQNDKLVNALEKSNSTASALNKVLWILVALVSIIILLVLYLIYKLFNKNNQGPDRNCCCYDDDRHSEKDDTTVFSSKENINEDESKSDPLEDDDVKNDK